MIIWYPETKGKSLEEMDGLFGKLLTDTESRGHVTKDADEEGEGVVEQQVVIDAGKRWWMLVKYEKINEKATNLFWHPCL